MGTVHKLPRPPKNRQQFKGYRPSPSGSGGPPRGPRRPLRGWQRSLIAWALLIGLAVAVWAVAG